MLSRRILPVTAPMAKAGTTLLAQTPPLSVRGEVQASHGIVAAGRTFTADAEVRLMTAGGNAIDGGVAAIFAAAVTGIVAARVDPATRRLRGGADLRRERAIVTW